MKRIISTIIAVVMLVALTTVSTALTVSAWTAPASISNTNEVFNTDYHFYATKGTPTVDGTIDAEWADAYTLGLNATRKVDPKCNIPQSLMTNVYVMWDENNLYILDMYMYDDPVYAAGLKNNYSGKDCSLYYIVLPNEMKSGGMGAVNMPHVAPGDVSKIKGAVNAVPSNVFGRDRVYKTKTITSAGNTVGSVWTYDDSALKAVYDEGIKSYTGLTENGWFMETSISWDLLDRYNSSEFDPSVGTEIGFLVNSNNGSGNGSYYYPGGDHIGFSVLELVDTGCNPKTEIIPDISWYNDPSCRTDDGYYMISDAGDLYGLALLSLADSTYSNYTSIGVTYTSTNVFYSGKKFRIMNDIDLNPGWTVESGKTPKYQWPVINFFADAEIDGNDKVISGLYNVQGTNYTYTDGHGFIGRMGKGVYIHDLTFVNGKLVGDTNDDVGTVAGLVNSNSTPGDSRIKNVSSSLILESVSSKKCGGIVGGNWTGEVNKVYQIHNLLLEDCTFAGTATNGISGQINNGGTRVTMKNCYSSSTSNQVSASVAEPAYVQTTGVSDGKYSVRIFTGLSTLTLDSVGFDFSVKLTDGTVINETYSTASVYSSIVAAGEKLTALEATGHPYLYALTIKNIPADQPVEITVTPFRTMTNGVKAYSFATYSALCYDGELYSVDTVLWQDTVPEYTATAQTEFYTIDSKSVMKEYGSATKANFDNYIVALRNEGFTVESQTSMGNNHYALCRNALSTVYVTYLDSTDSIRVYIEMAGHFNYPSAEAPEYVNKYTPKMWQLRVDNINSRENGGMSYVWLLADGTFFIIDGGYNTEAEANNLYNFLKAKNPNPGEPVISGWYFSHTHGDHIGAIQAFAPRYASKVDVKAFYYHFENSIPAGFKNATSYWPNATHYGRLHTGMNIKLQGIDFNVIYTLEDLYKTNFGSLNGNNLCTVIQVNVTVNGTTQKIMFLGDIQIVATNCIKSIYGSYLSNVVKSDIVQFSHHGYEGADQALYDAIAAPVVIWPINVVSTQKNYGSICNVFTKWGMATRNTNRTETDPVTGQTVSAYFPNKYIWETASYVKKIIIAGESEYQEFSFPYVYSGAKKPDVAAIYERDLPILIPDQSKFTF